MSLDQGNSAAPDQRTVTPAPWSIYDDTDPHHIKIKGTRPDIGGAHVADVLFPETAEFILKAVNSYDAIIDALFHARAALCRVVDSSPAMQRNRDLAITKIDNALTAAKGEGK